jgi:hypothetical protein
MNWDVLTKWYTLLPASLAVGPVFSVLGIDAFIHKTILDNGGGKKLISKNDVTKTIDSVVVGSPFWIAISSIFLQPFWGGGFPVKYVSLLLAGGLLKLLYGRAYIYEPLVSDASAWWDPIWKRKPDNLWDELGRMFTKFAYPSVHTLAIAGAVIFGVHSPAAWILLGVAAVWLILANHQWFSDVAAAGALAAAFLDMFN